MTEAQRLEVMQMVASGGLSVDAAMEKVLAHEQQHAAAAAAAGGDGADGAGESGGSGNSGVGSDSSVGTAVNPSPSSANHRASFGAGLELANTPTEAVPSSSPAPTTPQLRSNPSAKTPQPSRPAPPASGSKSNAKKKQPPRPNRRPTGQELKLEDLSLAQPQPQPQRPPPPLSGSSAEPSSAPATLTASQATNPFGTTPPATPPHSAGVDRPASTNPFL